MSRSIVNVDGKWYVIKNETGEVIKEAPDDCIPIWVKKGSVRRKPFMILYQSDLYRLAKLKLKPSHWRVLLMVMALVDFENRCYEDVTSIAHKLNMARQHCFEYIKDLIGFGFLHVAKKGRYVQYLIVDAEIAWKGSLDSQADLLANPQYRSNAGKFEALSIASANDSTYNAKCICGSSLHSNNPDEYDDWVEAHNYCDDFEVEKIFCGVENQLGIE